MTLILASSSPRRRAILTQLRIAHEVDPAFVDESQQAGEEAQSYVRRMAGDKALAVSARRPGALVLGADTIVCLRGEILGKPGDPQHALDSISALAGEHHEVTTAVALARDGRLAVAAGDELLGATTTRVTFRELSADTLRRYVATEEGADKAGGYAIQGIGAGLVERIEGCYLNVVGLPGTLTLELLEAAGVLAGWP